MNIPVLSSFLHYYKVFYGYVGKKLYLLCCIILLAGMSETVGITMLLPIINYSAEGAVQSSFVKSIYRYMEFLGIGISLQSLLVIIILIFSLKGVLTFIQMTLSAYIATNLVKKLKIEICKMYASMNYNYYTNSNIGYLNNVVTTETDRAVATFNKYIDVIVCIIYMAAYLSFAFIIDWSTTLLTLGICSCMFVALRKLVGKSRTLSVLVSETNAQIQSLLIQTIQNFKYLKATNSFARLYKQLFNKIDENRKYHLKNGVIHSIAFSIPEPIAIFFMSGLIIYQVSYKSVAVTEVFILLFFFYRTFLRVFTFQKVWQDFNARIGGLEVLRKVSRDLQSNEEKYGIYPLYCFKKNIELKEVHFAYGPKQVLSDINMVICKNSSVGIVGESGAGKTTIFDILTGLITPQSGTIWINGKNYEELDLSSLRRKIGYVMQEPVIFNDTIANNVSFWERGGKNGETVEKIMTALELSYCMEFIKDSTNGIKTIIGDKGIKLSGGQRQRIAIARELYKNPEILIFDEATSSLDSKSENFIRESINSMMGKQTVIIIAHRLSTIKNCDYIYVLDKGRIVQQGTFDELYLNKKSHFYNMCKAQNL